MIIVGNGDMLCNGSHLWQRVASQLADVKCYHTALPLMDNRFGETIIPVSNADELNGVLCGNYKRKSPSKRGSPKNKTPASAKGPRSVFG